MPYRQSETGDGVRAKLGARSVSKGVGNAMAAPCGMRTRYNRPLRRLTRPDVSGPTIHFDRPPAGAPAPHLDRKSVGEGKSVDLRGRRIIKKARGGAFQFSTV